ncbi:MAG: hypothetical protein D6713_00970 [Deltaproteobacteria bacterium]|nr:MAG: hypothetical protein D6713_00970 [Deltaproteobacteria bacterium]
MRLKPRGISAVWALVLFALLLSSGPAFGEVTLIYPQDRTLVAGKSVTLYGYTDGEESFQVQVNFLKKIDVESEGFFSVEVPLIPALNVVSVGGETVRLFSLPGAKLDTFVFKTAKEETTFTSFRLHPALEEGCESCHSLEEGDLQIPEDLKETCFSCHEDFTKDDDEEEREFIHGPVAEGECVSCHTPHFSKNPKLLVEYPPGKLCVTCHDDKDPSEVEGTTIHRPVAKLECQRCHSPHASDAEYQLVRKGNSLCLGCHETPHPNHRKASTTKEMTVIPDDFPRDGEENLACIGCHSPHFSENPRLFRIPEVKLCTTCHRL